MSSVSRIFRSRIIQLLAFIVDALLDEDLAVLLRDDETAHVTQHVQDGPEPVVDCNFRQGPSGMKPASKCNAYDRASAWTYLNAYSYIQSSGRLVSIQR